MHNQIYQFLEAIFSKYQCGFCKSFNTQQFFKESVLDKGKSCGDLLTELPKFFDCVVHDLFVAEFHAYSFDDMSLQLIYNYLFERKQRIKRNSS